MELNENSGNLRLLIERARSIHGHLGPFLVLGVRMSIAGMERLGMDNMQKLRVEVELPRQIPYTCTLDGIQASTQCTFGNQKLTIKEADSQLISARFSLNETNRQIIVSLKSEVIRKLMKRLKAAGDESAQERLAWMVASMPEDELFSIKVQ